VVEGGLIENARVMGEILLSGLKAIGERYPAIVGAVHGRGLVAGLHMVRAGGTEPDGDLAFAIVEKAVQKGLLLFAPVGFGGGTVKIAPPLTITEAAIRDGLVAFREAIEDAVADLGR
jgi:4-aminobutyrate aminotransferase-like enzyme